MTKNKKQQGASEKLAPLRLCISCGGYFPKEKLIRVLKEHKTNELIINPDNKTFGRSAYICPDKKCLEKAIKKNRFGKTLKIKIDESLFKKLKIMIN